MPMPTPKPSCATMIPTRTRILGRGKPAPESIAIVAYDPEWPARYDGWRPTCGARWARLPWTSSI